MVNKTNFISIIISFILTCIILGGIIYIRGIKQELTEQKSYNEQVLVADSIKSAKLQTALEKKFFLYRDSIENAAINSIIQNNEKNKKKLVNLRKSIPTASDATKDSIWSAAWNSKDTIFP